MNDPALAVVVKGWPRLSETFIAQELAALEAAGIQFDIWSLRFPTDKKRILSTIALRHGSDICRSTCIRNPCGFCAPG